MNKFFGWYGTFDNTDFSPQESTDRMSKAFNRHLKVKLQNIESTNNCGLASVESGTEIYSDDSYHIVLMGSYNWGSEELIEKAKSVTTTNILIDLYQNNPDTFLNNLKGTFSICLIDKGSKSLYIAIDRLGIHSLYYSIIDQGIVFSSLCNSVKSHPAVTTSISNQAIYDYIYFHMIPSPRTIYNEMKKLPPGHVLLHCNGKTTITRYWNPKFNDNPGTEMAPYTKDLKRILPNTVRKYSDAKNVGAFLSGGLDSSTVVGLLSESRKKKSDNKVKSFTIGFVDAGEYDEVKFARTVVKHFEVEAYEYYVKPEDVVSAIPEIAKYYDEPFGNSSALPTYFCAKLAKENHIKTLLAGDGGDELFAGNARYAKQGIFELYSKLPKFLRTSLIEPLFVKNPLFSKLPLLSKVSSYIRQANVPLPDRLESYNFLHQFDPRDVFSENFLATIDTNAPICSLRDTYQITNSNSSLNKMLFLDWKVTLADNDLRKVVAMCDMADINVQFPLLDDELVEFSTQLPPNFKLKGQNLRYFFRDAMTGFLPTETLTKKKHGFGLPFGLWMHDYKPLQDFTYNTVHSIKKRDIFKDEFIEKIINLHKNQHASYYGEMIWVIMMLELWLQNH